MKICIVTDAWRPQINGVVITLENTIHELKKMGHEILVIEPNQFLNMPCPTYPDIRLALFSYRKLSNLIKSFQPDAIHIATEGPLGLSARRYALKFKCNFTTAYHTIFPEYLEARTGISAQWFYPAMRWFHKPSKAVMVATDSVLDELKQLGFKKLVKWGRGVNTELFCDKHQLKPSSIETSNPIFIYVGRISIEKNIEAFLNLKLPGEKWLIGDGPALNTLQDRYPDAEFFGAKTHEELAELYQRADVFVFPSKTDTFGLVILEALACGLTVAAYPVTGPIDVLANCEAAALRHDLHQACMHALELNPKHAITFAEKFSWESTTQQFVNQLFISNNPVSNSASMPIQQLHAPEVIHANR